MNYKVTTKDGKGDKRTFTAKIDDEFKDIIGTGLTLTAPIAVGPKKKVDLNYKMLGEDCVVQFDLNKENDRFDCAEVIIFLAKELLKNVMMQNEIK